VAGSWDLFFSYRRQDLERARPLLQALAELGVVVWRDENEIPEQASITKEIRHGIAHFLIKAFVIVIPVFISSIWLWLYAGSGLILKAARSLDLGYEWFSRHFDIENKPLSSIGLIAGTLVAVVYWTVAAVVRLA